MSIRISKPIVDMLMERGMLPKHCRNVTLTIPPNSAMVLTFEILVATEHLDVLGEAFTAQAAIARKDDDEHAKRNAQVVSE